MIRVVSLPCGDNPVGGREADPDPFDLQESRLSHSIKPLSGLELEQIEQVRVFFRHESKVRDQDMVMYTWAQS